MIRIAYELPIGSEYKIAMTSHSWLQLSNLTFLTAYVC